MNLLLLPHLYGLDAALVALLWQELAARQLGFPAPPPLRVILFASVWGIYLLDRLWDVRRLPREILPARRHEWARRYPLSLMTLGTLNLLVAGGVSAWFLSPALLLAGSGLILLCALYYLLHVMSSGVRAAPWRALLLGLIFALGSAGAPWLLSGPGKAGIPWVLLSWAVFAANALSCMVAEDGAREGRERVGRRFLGLRLLLLLLALGLAVWIGAESVLLSVVLLGAGQGVLGQMNADRFCALCDAALLLPACWLVLR